MEEWWQLRRQIMEGLGVFSIILSHNHQTQSPWLQSRITHRAQAPLADSDTSEGLKNVHIKRNRVTDEEHNLMVTRGEGKLGD